MHYLGVADVIHRNESTVPNPRARRGRLEGVLHSWSAQRTGRQLGARLYERFDLVYGTSTGAIIAALIALGHSVQEISDYYEKYVPVIMKSKWASARSTALANLAVDVFGKARFDEVKTRVGIVSTKWLSEEPMIFKGDVAQAHGRTGTFVPGFGVSIGDAIQASCSAYPFFNRKVVTTSSGDKIELLDGGYCANNPTLYAIADGLHLCKSAEALRVVNIGVGIFPQPKNWTMWFFNHFVSVELLQKTLEINNQSMERLRSVMFKTIPTVRISDTFDHPELATDFLEHDLKKLNQLRQRGADSFAPREQMLRQFFQ